MNPRLGLLVPALILGWLLGSMVSVAPRLIAERHYQSVVGLHSTDLSYTPKIDADLLMAVADELDLRTMWAMRDPELYARLDDSVSVSRSDRKGGWNIEVLTGNPVDSLMIAEALAEFLIKPRDHKLRAELGSAQESQRKALEQVGFRRLLAGETDTGGPRANPTPDAAVNLEKAREIEQQASARVSRLSRELEAAERMLIPNDLRIVMAPVEARSPHEPNRVLLTWAGRLIGVIVMSAVVLPIILRSKQQPKHVEPNLVDY